MDSWPSINSGILGLVPLLDTSFSLGARRSIGDG